jgi:hypothetical protein
MLGRQVDVSKPRAAARSIAASARSSRCAAGTSTAFPLPRVIDDIADARGAGARDLLRRRQHHHRRPALRGTVPGHHRAGFNDVDYIVQGMTAPFATHGATLAPLMKKAGFRYVFPRHRERPGEDLAFLKAAPRTAGTSRRHARKTPRWTRSTSSTARLLVSAA